MNNWITSDLTELEWDNQITSLSGNYRQLYSWGEYKKSCGWEIQRLIYINDSSNKIKSLVQIMIKGFYPFYFIYIPGGITDGRYGVSRDVKELIKHVKRKTIKYVRIDSNYRNKNIEYNELKKINLYRPIYNINSSASICINLSTDSNPLKNATSKWKYNLRKSLKNNIKIVTDLNPSYEEIEKITEEMQRIKKNYRADDPINFLKLSKHFKHKILFKKCTDSKNNIIGFRSALLINDRAWDYFGATNQDGRNLKVGYSILSEILIECQKLGIKNYNLGAIEEIKSPGVANFKINTGGEKFNFVGEWEYSNTIFFNYAVNLFLLIVFKLNIKKIF